jgi:hypothetical protein
MTTVIAEQFSPELGPHWHRYARGQGALEHTGTTICFTTVDASARKYSVAQIDDYYGRPRGRCLWSPPLQLTVRARFSHPGEQLRGTAGFGFWNDPFDMANWRLPALPRALWFFYASPPSNMKLDLATPGHGWKAATLDTLRPSALLLAALAPVAALLMNIPSCYQALWPAIQRAIHVQEALVGAGMTIWQTYALAWDIQETRFLVNGTPVLEHAPSPRGPLGFVMWLDTQYMVITPWGRFRWGVLDAPGRQAMEVDWLKIESGAL